MSLGGGSAVSENASTVERALVPGGGSAVSENALEMEEAIPSGARTVEAETLLLGGLSPPLPEGGTMTSPAMETSLKKLWEPS